jgi:hypothetical protein
MSKRKRIGFWHNVPSLCVHCKVEREQGTKFYGGWCTSCHAEKAAAKRKVTATKLLARGKQAEPVERNGQEFAVVVLPPKRGKSQRRRRTAA